LLEGFTEREAIKGRELWRLLKAPLETVKLTASFKLDGSIPESLFSTYREVLGQLLDYACARGITSFRRLKAEKYHELRARHPSLPSHYIYTACQIACSIYKSFRKLRRRVEEVYHKLANQIVDEAKELKASTIVLEELANMRKRVRRSKAVNGRLNRWSFRKLQEYEVKLAGLNVTYAEGASSLCPTCGEKLSPNGYRRLKCSRCGLEEDRDIIAVKNLLHRYQMDIGASSVHPESFS
jgi:IS605 OrfB family transposase